MDIVQIANVLLTRRCNLRCSYCSIVTDYEGMPDEYPLMTHYHNNELTSEKWIDLFKRIRINNPDCFFILYGGEPTLVKDLWKIVKWLNDNDVAYTIITNNTNIATNKLIEIYNKSGKIRGLTSSCDPVFLMPDRQNDDIAKKSRKGLDNLAILKSKGIADDVVAEITIMKESIPYLYQLIEMLSERGIYSSITAVDDQKSSYYDFSNVGPEVLLEPNDELRTLFDMIIKDAKSEKLLVHIPELLNNLYDCLPSKMKCTLNKDVHNITIEPDGSLRLCLRVRGVMTPFVTYDGVDNIISLDGKLLDSVKHAISVDYSKFCLGCNWTCPIMSDEFSKHIKAH